MHRLISLTAACLLAGGIAFAQTVTEQPSGTQPNPNSVNATPNSNATNPANAQGRAARTPSHRNQTLPGNSNPANAATSDAGSNGQAVQPNSSGSGTPGTAAGNTPNPDNSDNNGMAKDATGANAAKGNSNKITNPGTAGVNSWLWVALIIIVAIVLFAVLFGRDRARGNINPADPALRATRDRDEPTRRDDQRRSRDDQIRRAG